VRDCRGRSSGSPRVDSNCSLSANQSGPEAHTIVREQPLANAGFYRAISSQIPRGNTWNQTGSTPQSQFSSGSPELARPVPFSHRGFSPLASRLAPRRSLGRIPCFWLGAYVLEHPGCRINRGDHLMTCRGKGEVSAGIVGGKFFKSRLNSRKVSYTFDPAHTRFAVIRKDVELWYLHGNLWRKPVSNATCTLRTQRCQYLSLYLFNADLPRFGIPNRVSLRSERLPGESPFPGCSLVYSSPGFGWIALLSSGV
jgi:hypothetical protein